MFNKKNVCLFFLVYKAIPGFFHYLTLLYLCTRMETDSLQNLYREHPQVKRLSAIIKNESTKSVVIKGVCASAPPLIFSSIYEKGKINTPILFILNDLDDAGYFYHDLCQIRGDEDVLFFPSSFKRAIRYGQKDAANEVLRTEVLSRIGTCQQKKAPLMIVTYPDALAEKVVSERKLQSSLLSIKTGDVIDMETLRKKLISLGFEMTDYVYEPGKFALRGSILDIFPYSSEVPYRIDFFGDDIDSIRSFNVETQLSDKKLDSIQILPDLKANEDDAVSLMALLPSDSWIAYKDKQFIIDCLERIRQQGFSQQAEAEAKEQGLTMTLPAFFSGKDFSQEAGSLGNIAFGHAPNETGNETILEFHQTPQPVFHKNFDLVSDSFANFLKEGYTLYILADSEKQPERLKAIFDERDDKLPETEKKHISFIPVNHTLHEGFSDLDLKCCLFTDHQLFDRYHKYNLKSDKARTGRASLTMKELNELKPGDYVVHIDHGIGQFAGLIRMPNGNSMQEMMKINYLNGDAVFVSIHSLHKVSKYRGKDGLPPKLSKLGTGAWERLKDRTKKKIKDIARDLIKLYAQRRKEKGFSFSPDTFLQHELEAGFIYEDTPDQLKATKEVKSDMEKSRPMDRLVCGDVGFGKTEVAIRAAFKACCDNKQVAVLVPTTVLAYQHFQTFSNRLKDFPVKVDYLTRARTPQETKSILKDLSEGKINILIGTHKLIGKTVKFHDLGLLIIDEEQKFGVSVKEKLRQLKVNVDTLTLTATPIPRTLQFSLMGARDLSVIQTPPPNRYPIQTEVHTFSPDIIKEAINFEMSRNGQVFFVSNRISSLIELENLIHKYVPDARVCIGHGQMPPDKLEKIIYDFMNYDYDVLLSTTIVENGIDIPNANTIIINAAQNFGLSDLHQMRGRVGRGNRKAFCYLLAPPLSALNVEARRRLEAIESFSDLGSGIHIAMQDLDIRGAGNMLGAEQSGFIADLGYETYQKILTQAVDELKNDEFANLYATDSQEDGHIKGDNFVDDCTIESDLPMFFPESYVPSSSERMLLYRELDNLTTDDQVTDFKKKLIDRFGQLPKEGKELLNIVPLRRMGKDLGMEKIILKQNRMSLYFVSNPDSPYYKSAAFDRCLRYITMYPKRCNLRVINNKRNMIIKDVKTVEDAEQILRQILSIQLNS